MKHRPCAKTELVTVPGFTSGAVLERKYASQNKLIRFCCLEWLGDSERDSFRRDKDAH